MIFILGGNGFVGSAFVRFCKQHDIEYAIITRHNQQFWKHKSCDVFINCNGNAKKYLADKQPANDFRMNVQSTVDVLHDFNYNTYVHISTVDVYHDPSDYDMTKEDFCPINVQLLSNYGFSKLTAENAIVKYCPENYIIFRLGGVVGKNLKKNVVYDIINKRELFISPDSTLQFINTDEVANLVFTVLNHETKQEIINLCGTGCLSVRDIGDIFGVTLPENDAEPQHYNVNNEKIQQYAPISTTEETLRHFKEELLR